MPGGKEPNIRPKTRSSQLLRGVYKGEDMDACLASCDVVHAACRQLGVLGVFTLLHMEYVLESVVAVATLTKLHRELILEMMEEGVHGYFDKCGAEFLENVLSLSFCPSMPLLRTSGHYQR